MSLHLVHIGGGGVGHYNCEQRLSRMCKKAYRTEMLTEVASHWPFITVT